MHWLDIVILALVGIGLVWGAFAGLLRQVSRIVTFILAVYFALAFNGLVAQILQRTALASAPEIVCRIAACVLVFLCIWVIMLLVTGLMQRFITSVKLQWVNRLLGAAFGGLKIILILGVAIAILSDFEEPRQTIEGSRLAGAVTAGMEIATGFIPEARAQPQKDSHE